MLRAPPTARPTITEPAAPQRIPDHLDRYAAVGAALAALVVLLAIGFGVDLWTRSRLIDSQREDIMLRLAPYSNTISVGLRRRLERLNGLKAFVEGTHSLADVNREFPVLAEGLLQGASGVRALELLKDGRVRWVYPLKGNEKALNLDVIHDPRPEVSRPVERLSETDSVVMSGPVTLAQGGVGLIARQHIRTRGDRSPPDAATVVRRRRPLAALRGRNARRCAEVFDVALLDRDGKRMGSRASCRCRPIRFTSMSTRLTVISTIVGLADRRM